MYALLCEPRAAPVLHLNGADNSFPHQKRQEQKQKQLSMGDSNPCPEVNQTECTTTLPRVGLRVEMQECGLVRILCSFKVTYVYHSCCAIRAGISTPICRTHDTLLYSSHIALCTGWSSFWRWECEKWRGVSCSVVFGGGWYMYFLTSEASTFCGKL